MRVGVKTDVGRARRLNEDAYLVDPPWFAVADGMGGHAAGEVASALAVQAVRSYLAGREGVAEQLVREAMHHANGAVWTLGSQESALRGMGTTLTLVKLEPNRCVIGHVGDSRAYLFRDTGLQRLTSDHSVVEELVRTGTLSERDAMEHPQRNLLTRALGVAETVDADIDATPILPGDRILLCTDGLTSVVTDEEIREILKTEVGTDESVSRLVRLANDRGGPDNITVLLIDMPRT